MKKLSLLLFVCMVSMSAFAQSGSPADSIGGGPHLQGLSQELASDNEPPPRNDAPPPIPICPPTGCPVPHR